MGPQVLANIETAQRQNKLFAALKQGNSALADLRKDLSLEDVEKLMSESAEHKEYEDRMKQILGESLTPEEDAAALEEFERLEAQENAEEEAELPAVPTVRPTKHRCFEIAATVQKPGSSCLQVPFLGPC